MRILRALAGHSKQQQQQQPQQQQQQQQPQQQQQQLHEVESSMLVPLSSNSAQQGNNAQQMTVRPPDHSNNSRLAQKQKQQKKQKHKQKQQQRRGTQESGCNINEGLYRIRSNDPNFKPTAYPLTRSDPRGEPKPRWGSLELPASAETTAQLQEQLRRIQLGGNKNQPLSFRIGPKARGLSYDEERRASKSSGTSRASTSEVDLGEPKYAFISQDGKLVEREVYAWPKQKRLTVELRYKTMEPFASQYGRMAAIRSKSSSARPKLPRDRCMYEKPIYRLPKSIVMENKLRLLRRHGLKDSFEPISGYQLPFTVGLQESEQCKLYSRYKWMKYQRDTRDLLERGNQYKVTAFKSKQQALKSDA